MPQEPTLADYDQQRRRPLASTFINVSARRVKPWVNEWRSNGWQVDGDMWSVGKCGKRNTSWLKKMTTTKRKIWLKTEGNDEGCTCRPYDMSGITIQTVMPCVRQHNADRVFLCCNNRCIRTSCYIIIHTQTNVHKFDGNCPGQLTGVQWHFQHNLGYTTPYSNNLS